MLAALSFNLLVIGRFFTAQTGAVNSRCCIEAVANAKNWLKGGANYTGVNPCIRTEQVSRMFEAQSSRKKLYYNYEIGEHIQIKNGAGTTPRHNNNNQENTENYY